MARVKSHSSGRGGAPADETLTGGQRRGEIAVVLLQNGWGVLVRQLGLLEIIPGGWRQRLLATLPDESEDEFAPPLPVPGALRKTLEELGPTFIKLGQVLSTRADLLPEDYIEELKKLQQNVPPAPWPLMEQVILTEWNASQLRLAAQDPAFVPRLVQKVSEIFPAFDPVPLAAGSLGQAYRASIEIDGALRPVIVKVQRPGIVPVVEADIKILHDIVGLVERTRWGRHYNFMDMVAEFASVIRNELDFVQEAYNTEAIGNKLKEVYTKGEIQTPNIHWAYTSQRMLTMEFIQGESIELFFIHGDDQLLAKQQRIDEDHDVSEIERERKRLARIITNSFLQQIFIDGFFHADPHPGNLMLLPDYEAGHMSVVLLDFGMVGRVDPRSRAILIDFLLAIIKFDSRRATDRIMEFGKAPASIDRRQFAQDLDHILRATLGKPLREVRVGKILQDILNMTLRYRIQLPGIFITLIRVLITIEGICRQLDRDYILIQAAEPFVVQA
ncbi:MAG: ABC1 kinase family protein, partial [Candidatus Sericytochromatia bacterium]